MIKHTPKIPSNILGRRHARKVIKLVRVWPGCRNLRADVTERQLEHSTLRPKTQPQTTVFH